MSIRSKIKYCCDYKYRFIEAHIPIPTDHPIHKQLNNDLITELDIENYTDDTIILRSEDGIYLDKLVDNIIERLYMIEIEYYKKYKDKYKKLKERST